MIEECGDDIDFQVVPRRQPPPGGPLFSSSSSAWMFDDAPSVPASTASDLSKKRPAPVGVEPKADKKKRQKTVRERLEKTLKKRAPSSKREDGDGLIVKPLKRGAKQKTATEKHLKHITSSKKKTNTAVPKRKKKTAHSEDDNDDEDDDDEDAPPTPPCMEDDDVDGDASLSSASERRTARSRIERQKKKRKDASGGHSALQQSVSLHTRGEMIDAAQKKLDFSARAAANARATDALALELFNSMKKAGTVDSTAKIETFSKLMTEHPEAASTTATSSSSSSSSSMWVVSSAASVAEQHKKAMKHVDTPIPTVPFTVPLIQAISNTCLAIPTLERYGDPLTPDQLKDQLAQKRLACPLLKTGDLSALFAEAGSIKTPSGRILTFPPCIQGIHCQGKVAPIDGLTELPLKERPVLMGFIYEHEMVAYLQCQADLPTDRKCVMCMGVDFGSTLLAIRGYSYKIHVEQMALLQTYRVPVDAPGGYHRSCVYVPEPKEYRFDPFPRIDTSFYRAYRDPSVQLMTGAGKSRARWIIDDSATHYCSNNATTTVVAVPPPAAITHNSRSSSSSSDGTPKQSTVSRYMVYAEISITQPEKQKAAKQKEEKRINSKENTRGKYRPRQSEREKAIKDNYAHSGEASRMRLVRCSSMHHNERVLELLPWFIGDGVAAWTRPTALKPLLSSTDMTQAHKAAAAVLQLIPVDMFLSVVPTLCLNILSASGSRCNSESGEYTKERVAELMLTHLCPGRRAPGLHCSLFVQVVRLTVLALLLDMVHAREEEKTKEKAATETRRYNVIVYHLQCMVDSLWHVPYYICEASVRYERNACDPSSIHESYLQSTSSLYVYLERACVPAMNATSVSVACDRTIPYVSEFDKVYTKTHEKGKMAPAEHLFRKILLTRNNRRKFQTVIWNYAELDEWFKDMVIRIIMSGILGNYACITRRRPDRRIPLQARFVMYKMHSAISRNQQGEEFYRWVFMGIHHLCLYTTHLHSLSRILHHPALERHCRQTFNVSKYHRVVENAVSYAAHQFLQQVLQKPEVLSVHCLSRTPIPGMGTIASELNTQIKKECESMFLGLVHHKTVHEFLSSLRAHTRENPTVVWDHPRTSVRLHPYLASLVGPMSFCVLEYALEPGCDPHNTTGIDTLSDGDAVVEENVNNGGAPLPTPLTIPTECSAERFERLLKTRVPVRYTHLVLLRQAVRILHPLTRFPERNLLDLMPTLGCCTKAVNLVRDAIRCHEVDDKSGKKLAIENLHTSYPFSYSILQVYAELWRVHESAFTIPLPKHYYDAQVQAIRDRFHVPPDGPLPDMGTHILFCHCCGCTTTLIRDEETARRLDPNALTSEAAASSDAQRIVLGKHTWNHGSVQTFTKLPRSSHGGPTVHCVDEKIYLGEKCGQRPLAGILLLGKALVFRKHLITLCVGRGCGRPCVIAPKICEYSQMGYLCSVCSQVKRRTNTDPSTTIVRPRIPLPEIPADSATAAPRKYYYTNARREIAEKKNLLKKRKAVVVVCDACGADTDRPRVMTITQEAGLHVPNDPMPPTRTISSTLVLTVCGMHHHNALKYDLKKKCIEKVANPDCQKAGKCTCSDSDRTCTGLWTKESVVRVMNSLDPNLQAVIESRSIRKTLKRFKARTASVSASTTTRKAKR